MARGKPAMGEIRIGISGWRYEGWRRVFYPRDLPHTRELEFASRALPTIEINGSFCSLQTPRSYATWYRETPADFIFSVNGGRYVTHIRRLRNIETPLANFFASGVLELREKLGPFLWQFPPSFPYKEGRFERFFSLLPRDTAAASALARRRDSRMKGRTRLAIDRNRPLRHAVEIRHESFAVESFVRQLRRGGARRRRHRRQVAVRGGCHRGLHVPSPSRRRGTLRERPFGRFARSLGRSHPRLVPRPGAARRAQSLPSGAAPTGARRLLLFR